MLETQFATHKSPAISHNSLAYSYSMAAKSNKPARRI